MSLDHSHRVNNTITPNRPAVILVTWLLGLAGLLEPEVLDVDAAVPVAVLPDDPDDPDPVGEDVAYVVPCSV